MEYIVIFNYIISILFTVCYFYQFIYVFVGLLKKTVKLKEKKKHKYAVVVSARDEETVIGNFVHSIKEQDYPQELIDVFVVADNCKDKTAEVAEAAGAICYKRKNKKLVGKGYALDWLFEKIKKEHSDKGYEAFIIFDADNVVDSQFIDEMNKVFDSGYRIITSYRNSKNYDTNWITAGYSLWFLREARYLNNARMQLGTSCAVSGTGFLVSAELIEENGGWPYHLLTEDIEFTTDSIIKGEKIGYCPKAILYDEQPTGFYQSYKQRLRWAKGFIQVFMRYWKGLFFGIFKGNFSCYDMFMTLMPAIVVTVLGVIVNLIAIPVGAVSNTFDVLIFVDGLARTVISIYMMFFVMGLLTTVTEWKQIHCSKIKKILYLFTFPIFMLTYVPISLVALFVQVKWERIEHKVVKTVDDVKKRK